MIRLVAVDMDGTFLDKNKKYNRALFDKVYKYIKDNNIKFVVASGNQYYQLKSFFNYDDIIYVSENGGCIFENNNTIYNYSEDRNIIKRIVAKLKDDKRANFVICGVKGAYVLNSKAYKIFKPYFYKISYFDDFDTIEDDFIKVSIVNDEGYINDIYSDLINEFNNEMRVVSSGNISVDVLNDFSKFSAISYLCNRYDIDINDCIAFGDSMNDYEMIQGVGIGYVMANGNEKLKEVADEIIGSNDENGVLNKLVELFDININD